MTYKGRETHNTVVGGILTILVQIFTGVLIVTSFTEVFQMSDPSIVSFAKPLTTAEREELAPLSFDEYRYFIAVRT